MEFIPILMFILWIVVLLMIFFRKDHKVTFFDYCLCWACLMMMILKEIVR